MDIIQRWEGKNIFNDAPATKRSRKFVLNYLIKRYTRVKDILVPFGQSLQQVVDFQNEIAASLEFQHWAFSNYMAVVTNYDTGLGYRKTTINGISTRAKIIALRLNYRVVGESQSKLQKRLDSDNQKFSEQILIERRIHRELIAIENGTSHNLNAYASEYYEGRKTFYSLEEEEDSCD